MADAMTLDEARKLLPQYADGVLEPEPARALEDLLERTPVLRDELQQIRDENALLEEALKPLRASKSGRLRISEAMAEVHRQATHVAESLPPAGWRIFRLSFCLVTLFAATLLVYLRPPTPEALTASGVFLLVAACVFGIGLAFVLGGHWMAQAEARMLGTFSRRDAKASALEVLVLQVFGAMAVLGSLGMYVWLV
jgi:anti-sigma factor RsiW